MEAMEQSLDLDMRIGWPEELRFILERYPREAWPGHVNLAGMVRFWLDIHNGFRRAGEALRGSTSEFREGLVTPDRFRSGYAPRLQTFLGHLEGHHNIEDYQMFPLFNAAEPRLLKGFDMLERDHGVIHAAMERMAETANAFMQAPTEEKDKMRYAADAYAETADRLMIMLARHLGDEEDLVIPLILDRGEKALGL
jgi:hemerythrin-like domain-containing protein